VTTLTDLAASNRLGRAISAWTRFNPHMNLQRTT
jgi:hypothetical protein